MSPRRLTLALVGLVLAAPALEATAIAYPEFQRSIQARSGRTVNCAMCHTHPDGPEGTGPGQIGGLPPEELARLNQARGAFEPGQDVDSPILNEFGDSIVRSAGKRRVLETRGHAEELAAALDPTSDLDGDGIPDAREYLDGTHPLERMNGDPWLLFVTGLRRNAFHVGMIVVATALGIYGLASLLRASSAAHEATMAARAQRGRASK